MKILHIVNDLIRGGTEGQCARVVMGLTARAKDAGSGDVHRVAVFRRQGFFLERVEAVCGPIYEIKIRHLVRFSTFWAVFRLKQWILKEKFDFVHVWDAESAIFGGLAAVWAGGPLITSRRDLGQIYPGWKQAVLRRMDRRAVKVVVNAQAIGRHFAALGLDESKVCLIPNVMDLEEFDALASAGEAKKGELSTDCTDGHRLAENAECSIQNAECRMQNDEWKAKEALKIVCVSRMDPEKAHACLIRAFGRLVADFRSQISDFRSPISDSGAQISDFKSQISDLRSQISDCSGREPHLYLVGDGMEREGLEKLVFELEMGENVHFLGEKSEIPLILAEMDVGVLIPKANEGLSNSILEYMAAGLPVVCSDCGGNAELVQHGENGLVVPVSDENAVFSALKELKNAEIRQKMGQNGRKRVERAFSKDVVLEQFERLYAR